MESKLKIKRKGEKCDTFTEYRRASIIPRYIIRNKRNLVTARQFQLSLYYFITLANCTLDFAVIFPCCICIVLWKAKCVFDFFQFTISEELPFFLLLSPFLFFSHSLSVSLARAQLLFKKIIRYELRRKAAFRYASTENTHCQY